MLSLKEKIESFMICVVYTPCPARLSAIKKGGVKSACRDGFIRIANLTSPRPLREREEFLSELCELRNSGEGSNKKLTQFASLCEGKLFSDTLPLCSRYRFENLSLASFRFNPASAISPRPLRERAQSCLSRAAKATNAGVGLKTINQPSPLPPSGTSPSRGADARTCNQQALFPFAP